MNESDLDKAWKSDGNQLSDQDARKLSDEFMTTMHRRRRVERLWLIWIFATLGMTSILAGWLVLATDRVRLNHEWSLVPMLAIPWVFAVYFLRQYREKSKPTPGTSLTIEQTLKQSLLRNTSERRRLRMIGTLYLIMIPTMTIVIQQLENAGKVNPHEISSIYLFLFATLFFSGSFVAWRYFLKLTPEANRLQNLTKQYDMTSTH